MQSDSLFYQLFQKSPQVFFELVGTDPTQSGLYSFVSQEVKQTRFQLDGIFLPHHRRSDLPLYFVEVMGYKPKQGKHFYQELITEIHLYLNDYQPRNDWRATVIYTEHRFDPGIPIHLSEYANNPRLQILYLDRFPLSPETQSLEAAALQLIGSKPKATAASAQALVTRARIEITDAPNLANILELINTICVYKFPNLTREEIEKMLGLSELKQTKVYQEAKEEGRQEGRQEEKQEMARRLLTVGLTIEQIAQAVDLPIDAIAQIAESQS
jgi:predicted transposase/invertase (TIGR01784 family)